MNLTYHLKSLIVCLDRRIWREKGKERIHFCFDGYNKWWKGWEMKGSGRIITISLQC